MALTIPRRAGGTSARWPSKSPAGGRLTDWAVPQTSPSRRRRSPRPSWRATARSPPSPPPPRRWRPPRRAARREPDAVIAVHVADRGATRRGPRPAAARHRPARPDARLGGGRGRAAGRDVRAARPRRPPAARPLAARARVRARRRRRRAAALARRDAEQPPEPPDDASSGATRSSPSCTAGSLGRGCSPSPAPAGAARRGWRRSSRPRRRAAGRTAPGGWSWATSPTLARSATSVAAALGVLVDPGRGPSHCCVRSSPPPPAALPRQLRARARRRRRRRRRAVRGLPGGRDRRHQPGAARAHAASWCGGCRRCPPARRTRCSSSARRSVQPDLAARRGGRRRDRLDVHRGWTGRRSRSSWPPRGCGRSPRARSRPASTTASRCSCAARATPCRATRACSPRWRGATTCSTRPTAPCSAGSRCSRRLRPRGRARGVRRGRTCSARSRRLVDKSLVVAERRPLPAAGDDPRVRRRPPARRGRAARDGRPAASTHLLARLRDAAPLRDTRQGPLARRARPRARQPARRDRARARRRGPEPARALVAELPWLWQMHRQGREGTGLSCAGRSPAPRRPLRRAGAAADRRRARRRHGRPTGPRVRRGAARPRAGRRARRRAPALALPGAGRRRALLHRLRRGVRAGAGGRADRRAARATSSSSTPRGRCAGSSPTCATSTTARRRCWATPPSAWPRRGDRGVADARSRSCPAARC